MRLNIFEYIFCFEIHKYYSVNYLDSCRLRISSGGAQEVGEGEGGGLSERVSD